jgi:glutamate-1-semialdehyde 2,1-aminomutase
VSLSQDLLRRGQKVIPGGVNSPVRAFGAVIGEPPFIKRASGCHMWDVDGNRYVDLIGSWGPMIVGHAHADVLAAIVQSAQNGTSFGAPTQQEVLFAEELCEAHPSMDMVRLCSSGTEATMHAIRLARGYTKRDHIIKVDGCYHGAHDSVLVKAGSGVATFAVPGSPGIPQEVARLTHTTPFNDLEIVEQHLKNFDIACIILEAVPGNMGCIIPKKAYLDGLRKLCTQYGALLVIDEVMTGFRLSRGGACERLHIEADLVSLGKIVGGGLPLAAFGGRKEIMMHLSPVGSVYQAGTLSGNPLAVAAGQATLQILTEDFYSNLEKVAQKLEEGIRPFVEEKGYSFVRLGSMFTIFFRSHPPQNFAEVQECDFELFGQFHRNALNEGIYYPPSQYEAVFLGSGMSEEDIQLVIEGTRSAIEKLG